MQINSIKHSKFWLSFSLLLILTSLVPLFISCQNFSSPFKLGLDFTGGSKLEYRFAQELKLEKIEEILAKANLKDSQINIQNGKESFLILRTRAISQDQTSLDLLNSGLEENFGKFKIEAIDTVSPLIGPELLYSALIALATTIIGIIAYLSFRFQRNYALSAIITIFHDVIVLMGIFSFLGLYYGIEINSLFITALLSTFGFSIHDTIVVFDRIRENQKLVTSKFDFGKVAELSVNQVFTRSINTSFTALSTLAILFLFGGKSTQSFVGALFIGLFVGTYSSIFLASPLLVILEKKPR